MEKNYTSALRGLTTLRKQILSQSLWKPAIESETLLLKMLKEQIMSYLIRPLKAEYLQWTKI